MTNLQNRRTTRREVLRALTLAPLSMIPMATAGAVRAQSIFPSRPVSLIVPWTAGGATDVVMRAMAQAASQSLGQPIVVENKPGATGTIGPSSMAANAKPDGYTISQIPMGLFRVPLL